MALTDAQLKTVQSLTNKLQAIYDLEKANFSNISRLVAYGKATCAELQAYNLWTNAIYQEHQGLLTAIRGTGTTVDASGAPIPVRPPTPAHFVISSGSNCDKPKSLSGAIADAIVAPASGFFVSPNDVRIIPQGQGDPPSPGGPGLATISNALTNGQLGIFPVAAVVILSLIIVGIAIVAISAYFTEAKITERAMDDNLTNYRNFQAATQLRAQCYDTCTAQGSDPIKCAAACAKITPNPPTRVNSSSDSGGGWGFWTWTMIGAVGIIGGGFALKAYRTHQLETGGGSDH